MDRKELKRPDQFTTSITRFFGELAKNRKAVAVVALAVILGSAVAMLFISRKQADGQKAHDELFLANDAVDKRLEALSKAATDAAADSSTTQTKKPGAKKVPPKPEKSIDSEQFAFKKLNVDQEFADAVQKYKAVIEKFGSTRAAFEARTALGKKRCPGSRRQRNQPQALQRRLMPGRVWVMPWKILQKLPKHCRLLKKP